MIGRLCVVVEATVLKPRPRDFLHKVYMRRLFFDLSPCPREQTKQTGAESWVFVAQADRLCAYPDCIMPLCLIGSQSKETPAALLSERRSEAALCELQRRLHQSFRFCI